MKNTIEQKKAKLSELHDLENHINKRISEIDKIINQKFTALKKEKAKLVKRVKHNMLLRNKIIEEIHILSNEKSHI